jgi:RNA polymerase sigma factor (TIGR02999 family)
MNDLTALFSAAGDGDRAAMDRLMAVMYESLKGLAHARLQRSPRIAPLDTTELVHEAYLRFLKAGRLAATDREHFLAYSARVMRSIIVDFVRMRRAGRRGGGQIDLTLETGVGPPDAGEEEIVRVNDALEELAQAEPRLVQVVEMRYFAGLSEEEIASLLGIAVRTVRRDWRKARLLLSVALQ